jgi:hypothetical protein
LWHYTYGLRAAAILRDGTILPSPTEFAWAGYVWVSRNQVIEKTACRAGNTTKALVEAGLLPATVNAPMRFVAPSADAVPWTDLPLPDKTRRLLLHNRHAADPKDWFAIPHAVPIAGCLLQWWDGADWVDADREAIAALPALVSAYGACGVLKLPHLGDQRP